MPHVTKPRRSAAAPLQTAKGIAHAVGEATGAATIARALLGAEQAVIDRLVAKAREVRVPEGSIQLALSTKRKADRAMSVAALLLPFLPNPALLRVIAGTDDKPTKRRGLSREKA